jgi:dolichyl-phosphate-mannose--protein O-mannosyl transferase
MSRFIEKHYLFLLSLIVAFAFFTRIYRVDLPKEYIFDEVYHAVTAKLIRRNDPRAFEWWNAPVEAGTAVDWLHPPLAKYTQAIGMEIFGENSFGWRISSVIFGTLVVLATATLAQELFEDTFVALLSAAFAASDGLLLVQSRIAMNDIHVTFFILLALVCYVRYRKKIEQKHASTHFSLFLTGAAIGLAMASKWSGVFVLGIICGFEALFFYREIFYRHEKKKQLLWSVTKTKIPHLFFLLLLPACIYVLSYSQMFLQGKTLVCEGNTPEQGKCYCAQDSSWWVSGLEKIAPFYNWEQLEARGGCKRLISHFSELHAQIWWYQTNLKATHPFQSRPWQWFLDLRPVWYYVQYNDNTIANIYAFGNPALFWLGDIAVIWSIVFLVFTFLKKRFQFPWNFFEDNFAVFFLVISYFAVWIFWQLSPRIMFFYHYTPAVPMLCVLLAFWLGKIREHTYKNLAVGPILFCACCMAILLCFVVWFPDWAGLPVAKTFAEKVYFIFPNWR